MVSDRILCTTAYMPCIWPCIPARYSTSPIPIQHDYACMCMYAYLLLCCMNTVQDMIIHRHTHTCRIRSMLLWYHVQSTYQDAQLLLLQYANTSTQPACTYHKMLIRRCYAGSIYRIVIHAVLHHVHHTVCCTTACMIRM